MPTEPLDPATVIKNFCKILSAHNVTSVTMEYNGEGDSGDGDFSIRLPRANNNVGVNRNLGSGDSAPGGTEYRGFRTFIDELLRKHAQNGEPTLVTREKADEFEDAVFQLLPGGWEINDGSYGVVTVDVASGKITVDHNERVVDINSSTHTY
jgi:hypothetical protein